MCIGKGRYCFVIKVFFFWVWIGVCWFGGIICVVYIWVVVVIDIICYQDGVVRFVFNMGVGIVGVRVVFLWIFVISF